MEHSACVSPHTNQKLVGQLASVDTVREQVSLLQSTLEALRNTPAVVVAPNPAPANAQPAAPAANANNNNAAAVQADAEASAKRLATMLEQVRAFIGNDETPVPVEFHNYLNGLAQRVGQLNRKLYLLTHPDAAQELEWKRKQARMFKTPGNPQIGDHTGMSSKVADRLSNVFKYTQKSRKISRAEVDNMYGLSPDVKPE